MKTHTNRTSLEIIADILKQIMILPRNYYDYNKKKGQIQGVHISKIKRNLQMPCSQFNRYLERMVTLGLVVASFNKAKTRKVIEITQRGKELLLLYEQLEELQQPESSQGIYAPLYVH